MDYKEKLSQTRDILREIAHNLDKCKNYVNWSRFQEKGAELRAQIEKSDLWDNPQAAKDCLRESTRVSSLISTIEGSSSTLKDHGEILDILGQNEDLETLLEIHENILQEKEKTHNLVYRVMLSEPEDSGGCYVLIQSGAGGTDAQDWASMLLQMYLKWAQTEGHTAVLDDSMDGEEAGIKNATLRINGSYVYGFLKTETGIHRLVRQSPFNSASKRQTSFASVLVAPMVDDDISVEILEKDLRIDTYRASGAGGQHVNKTDSAVRITHLPSGIVVQCQSDRSQHRNKDQALKMLHSRLYAKKQQEQKEKEQSVEKTSIGWGHQIRSYVLHPYRLVKDLRTKIEHQNPEEVLQGGINSFLEAALVYSGESDD